MDCHRYNNENELVSGLIAGDEQAFTRLYHLYSRRLHGNLLKLVKSPDIADELLQEIFLRVWNNRHSIDVTKSFRSYIFKIGENLALDFFRKLASNQKIRNKVLLELQQDSYQHVEENITRKEDSSWLEHAINSLPVQRQQVFRLCRIEGRSYEEVSKLLGISTSTISDHILKANKSLRNVLSTTYKYLRPLLVIYLVFQGF